MTDEKLKARWGREAVDPHEKSLPGLKAHFLVDHAPAKGRLLEIGCGEGKLLATLVNERPRLELYGTDVQVPLATPHFQFKQCGNELPYGDGGFDAVVIFDVLEHVTNPEHMLDEARRVLKPGGSLIAFVPVEGEPLSFYTAFRALLGKDLYVETKEHVVSFRHRALLEAVQKRFDLHEVKYAYHLMGHLMDATFFAAGRLGRIRRFWWKENAFYNQQKKSENAMSSVLNRAMKLGNLIAYWESTWLSNVRATSAGVLFEATRI